MTLKFEGPIERTDATQITTRAWVAEPMANNAFNIVAIKRSDLEHMRTGRVNFIGDTKPKEGTLDEITDVYLVSWLFTDASGAVRARPIVGNYYGGFAAYSEAVTICNDVWRNRRNYRKPRPIQRVQAMPPRVLQ